MDYVREDLKANNIQKLPGLVKRSKNKQKGSLEESCESLIVGTADGREEKKGPLYVGLNLTWHRPQALPFSQSQCVNTKAYNGKAKYMYCTNILKMTN